MSTQRVILKWLRYHPDGATTKELRAVTGASDQVVRYHLRRIRAERVKVAGRTFKWRLPIAYSISSDGAAAVSSEFFWLPVDKVPPPHGVKMLLINASAGVAVVGQYDSDYWSHWSPLPRLVKDEF